ncbi:hypothetical protein DGI_2868 [Megalodesulfovibrio gigas DSM 1382 = ATCC 19364]|uniref:DUF2092 domain-containing protein n=1 Tax=Megalodesulfovibrio gigas (strain ATCC 19364 / DSM 1382 / NCIMB 9332 / VKM B-1759) TaxID=1121448 RepID=T2GDF8_MEGG1|nr:hypothetical protein DGI_2868 [Megalodesulfovibrio gigas DSM 1382 = ATCC 19364]
MWVFGSMGNAMAQPAAGKGDGDGLEPRAAAVYRNMCTAMDALQSFSVQADVLVDTVFEDGVKIQYGRQTSLDVRRPDHFRTVTRGDDFTVSTYFNGQTFTLALPKMGRYGAVQAGTDTNALLQKLSTEYGLDSPLGDVLMNKPCEAVQPTDGYYIGISMVEGVACHHLLFVGEDVDWQLWVEDSSRSLPRKLVITEKQLPASPQFAAVLRDWKMVKHPSTTFVYTPTSGCTFDAAMFANTTAAAP